MSHKEIQASLAKLKSLDINKRILAFQELLVFWREYRIPFIYDIIMKAYTKEPSPQVRSVIIKILPQINLEQSIRDLMIYYLTDNTSSCRSEIIKQFRERPSKEILNFLELIELEEEDRKLKKKIGEAINDIMINIGEADPAENIDETVENQKVNLTAKEKHSKSILRIQFNGTLTNYICMICKLKFKKGEIILQCKFCQSYFHKEHLLGWLEANNDCPVCDRQLI